jgi:hypothetical protein
MMFFRIWASAALLCSVAAVSAAPVALTFAGAPAGWTVDRYAPATFTDVGTYQGRQDVLEIGISANDGFANRPAAYQSSFYNTQGKSSGITGGAGDSLTASLYVSSSWADSSLGARRTDMWGVMSDSAAAVAGYPIIGYTNEGGNSFVGFRTWDDTAGLWHNLANTVVYDGWNELSIAFTGAAYEYSINGVLADIIAADVSALNFQSVIMQAYNFIGDPTWANVNANDYAAHWTTAAAAAQLSAPNSLALASVGLIGLGVTSRRRRTAR